MENRVPQITEEMKINAAIALADTVQNPAYDKVIPNPFQKGISDVIANAIK